MKTSTKFCVPLKVYYDRSCPLCATEMHALRDLDWRGRLQLVDCSARDFKDGDAATDGVTRKAMMSRIHARDPEGKWLVGLDAFEAVYAAAGLNKVASVWGDRRWRPLLDRIYPLIARYRQPLSRLGLHRLVGLLLRKATSAAECPTWTRAPSSRPDESGLPR
jgi:predicted DCC family thiol-disulfide oxidoreductase YuxK